MYEMFCNKTNFSQTIFKLKQKKFFYIYLYKRDYIMAAKTKISTVKLFLKKSKKKRKGIHAKTKTSNSKQSKNYKKAYASQGR